MCIDCCKFWSRRKSTKSIKEIQSYGMFSNHLIWFGCFALKHVPASICESSLMGWFNKGVLNQNTPLELWTAMLNSILSLYSPILFCPVISRIPGQKRERNSLSSKPIPASLPKWWDLTQHLSPTLILLFHNQNVETSRKIN